MHFGLIDQIVEIDRGKRIVAAKAVSLAEEYLADHFPAFPVLPGVLMLEAMVEAATWLVRDARDFDPTIILLKDARNVTYKSFVRPGDVLTVAVSCRLLEDDQSGFEGLGHCGEHEVVRGRFGLTHRPFGGDDTPSAGVEQHLAGLARARFRLLCGPASRSGKT